MNRRTFLVSVLARPAAGLAVVAAACGGDDGAPPIDAAPVSCLEHGTSALIFNNHGHVIMVSKEDVAAGATRTYDIGGGDHSHTVTITAALFARLASDQPVMVTSSVDLGHSHDISIRCV